MDCLGSTHETGSSLRAGPVSVLFSVETSLPRTVPDSVQALYREQSSKQPVIPITSLLIADAPPGGWTPAHEPAPVGKTGACFLQKVHPAPRPAATIHLKCPLTLTKMKYQGLNSSYNKLKENICKAKPSSLPLN